MIGILIAFFLLWLLWKVGLFTLKILTILFIVFLIGSLFHFLLIPAIIVVLAIMIFGSLQS